MLRYFLGLSLLTASIIAIRFFADKKISRKFQYALWILIPVYMCIAPFFTIDVSLPAKEIIVQEQATETVSVSDVNLVEGMLQPIQNSSHDETETVVTEKKSVDWPMLISNTSLIVSGTLLIAWGIYNLGFILYCRQKRQFIKRDPIYGLRVFKLDHPSAPFLLGNCIYLSDEVAESDISEYAICHEYCHYKHLDHVWTILRYVVLTFNWFNPLMWYAFRLVEEDCELACDEAVITLLGEERKIEYGKVLLALLTRETKRNFYVSTAMNDSSISFMKKRIKYIKNANKCNFAAIVVVGMAALAVVGCSLIDVNQETIVVSVNSTEIEHSESLEELNLSETTTVKKIASLPHPEELNAIETLYKTEVMPVEGSFKDGFYTVSMTPNYGIKDTGYECQFYPWLQLEVYKEFIDSLEEGQILDFTGWGGYSIVTVQSIAIIGVDPYIFLGTNYTGEVINLTTDKGFFNFCKVEGVDVWKAFKSTDEPLIMYYNPVTVSVADDCAIYDAFSFYREPKSERPTSEVYESVRSFTDKELTKGITDSIRGFFDKWHYDRYDYTVIKIENNTVTEVYFWEH